MAYLRFLTNADYSSIATEEHMKQVIREVPERFVQAEQRAEMNVREYLDQYYEIEKVLAVGKSIREYNSAVTYPAQIWIKKDDFIYKTLTNINGYKKPTKKQYWRHIVDFVDPCLIERAPKYSQLRMYGKGDVVRFGTEYWQCIVPHGYEAEEIHLPGVNAWKEAEVQDWEPNLEWEKDQVCRFNDRFYQYLGANEDESEDEASNESESEEETEEDSEVEAIDESSETEDTSVSVLTPEDDDCWGLIADYSEEYEYDSSEDVRDYVVAEDTVFYPILNPNPDKLEEGVNITRDDPRNANIVAHMCNIALYYLHQIISPTNISDTRKWAYEESMLWLHKASKFHINPQLPRKRERDSSDPKVDWALETFARDFNPHENAWLI